MYLRFASAIFALTCSLIATPAAASVLQPTGNWKLDYGDTQCAAAHSFGSLSAPIVLGIVPSLSGGTYKLVVSLPRTGPTFARDLGGSVDFGQGRLNAPLLYYGGQGVKMSIYQARLSAAQMEQAKSATTLTLRSETGESYSFPLADMPALLGALAKCTADLQHYWNMDGKALSSAPVAATGDLRSLITPSDYPTAAMIKQLQGTSRYQLLVDGTGAVAGCDVLSSSGVPLLDSTGCEVFKEKARFSPAKDRQGKPIRSEVTTPPITWASARNDVFDSGCSMMAGNMNTIVSMCDRRSAAPMTVPRAPPPPPPPPPPKH